MLAVNLLRLTQEEVLIVRAVTPDVQIFYRA